MENIIKQLPEWKKGYMAALIDGEFSLGVMKVQGKYFAPRMLIETTDSNITNMLVNTLGMGTTSKRKRGEHLKTLYSWSVLTALDVWTLLDSVRPYLITKRRQAEVLIEFCELKITHRFEYSHGERLKLMMHQLNKVGE